MMETIVVDPLVVSREERLRRYGVDCADEVVWRHWSVGGEYAKKLLIKNTHEKLQVIEYKLPQRKATFFVDFPAPVTLSSGMAFELIIKFRPSELVEFRDFIEIGVKGRGSFKIALTALTPFARLSVPEKHDFEFCAVGATVAKDITVQNTGTIPLDFYWEVPEPFDIQPRMGSLAEGEKLMVKASFHPAEATSVLCRAVCKGAGSHELLSVMKLSGIGKYAFVSFAPGDAIGGKTSPEECIDFGVVLTKSSSTKHVVVQNKSAVDAQFAIKRIDKDIVCPFQVSPMKGIVPRDGNVKLSIKYSPAGSGAHAANDFVLQTVGGNQLPLRCRGASTGPTAALSTSKLDFGDVNLDELFDPHASAAQTAALRQKMDKYVTLKNTTDSPIRFQFVGTNPGAAFLLSPFSGKIPAKGSQNIKVSFAPKQPLNYLRRAFLLINDTEQALFVDLLGTAYNAKSRAAPFSIVEARAFFARIEAGLGRCTPDDLAKLIENIRSGAPIENIDDAAAREAMLYVLQEKELIQASIAADNNKKPSAADAGKAGKPPTFSAVTGKALSSTVKRRAVRLSEIAPSEEKVSSSPFVLDSSQVVFRGFANEGETVTVRNNTGAKATATWCVPDGVPWSVTPETFDIPPFGAAQCRVRLAATTSGASFGCFLECYVNFKQMRSFRLVSDDTFCPPHCLLLQCQRLVSMSDTSSAPQVEAPSQLAFPPCHEKDSVLQVVSVTNKSDTVAAFSLQMEAQVVGAPKRQTLDADNLSAHIDPEDPDVAQRRLAGVFTCFPSTGVVPPNDTILLLMKFSPPDTARYVGVAKLLINDSPQGSRQIALRGEGFSPTLEVDGGTLIQFRPTSVCGSTKRVVTLRNPSRIPVRFDISMLGAAAGNTVFTFSPQNGVIAGCDKAEVQWTFEPQQGRKYDARVQIEVSANQPPAGLEDAKPTVLICQATGEGLIGVVSVEPLELDYESILVGESKSKHITIFNSSLCDLQYEVRWATRNASAHPNRSMILSGSQAPLLASAPEFINGRGVIRARSHVGVHVSLQPNRGSFEYIIYVMIGGNADLYSAPAPALEDILRLPHCLATAVGAFPFLQVTDVRSVLQPKSHLWRQLSVGAVNAQLCADLAPADLNREGFCFEQASEGLTAIPCDLGVDTFRTSPLVIMCRLDNLGSCRAKFRVWFPDESDIPKEPWHQTKLFNTQIADIMDAGLFDITPRDGEIEAGSHAIVTFTYKHTRIGRHELPVLVMLEQGKKLLLQLSATTLAENVPYLYFHHSMKHDLAAVAVGDLEPPLQYTELQNLSHQPVHYTLDERALAEHRENNFDFPVFQCLNPAGVIPPMSTMLLSWYFRPLEAVRYDVDLRMTVDGCSDAYLLHLGGNGYHPKKVTPADIKHMHQKDFLDLPKFPTLQHPLLPVHLSMDVLRFGSIPFHSLHRQVVRLYNDHPNDTFLFEWHCVLQYGDQIFDIDPPRGRLTPGEHATCRITLYSGSTSHIIDNPIHCHVLNEDLRVRRLQRRAELEKEAAMELDDEGNEDAAPQGLQKSTSGSTTPRVPAASSSRVARGNRSRVRQPITTVPAKFQNTNRLRETIQNITEAVVAQSIDDDSDELIYVDVVPTILELLVQARIMPVEAFHTVYGEATAKAVFFPTLSAFSTTVPPGTVDLSDASETEWSLVHDILLDVVKQVIHHERVQDALVDVSEDPVPYFCEMVNDLQDGNQLMSSGGTSASPIDPSVGLLSTGSAAAAAEKAASSLGIVSGDLQCLIEEVFESAIYGIISDATKTEDGVINAVLAKRQRSVLTTGAANGRNQSNARLKK